MVDISVAQTQEAFLLLKKVKDRQEEVAYYYEELRDQKFMEG